MLMSSSFVVVPIGSSIPATTNVGASERSGDNSWNWTADFYTIDPQWYSNQSTDPVTSNNDITIHPTGRDKISSGQMQTKKKFSSETNNAYFDNAGAEQNQYIKFGFTNALDKYFSDFYINSLSDSTSHPGKTFYITKINFNIAVDLQMQEWHYEYSSHTMTLYSSLWFSPAFIADPNSTSKGLQDWTTKTSSTDSVSDYSASELNYFVQGQKGYVDKYAKSLIDTNENDALAVNCAAWLHSEFNGHRKKEEDLYLEMSASDLNITLSGRWIDNAWNPPGLNNNPWVNKGAHQLW